MLLLKELYDIFVWLYTMVCGILMIFLLWLLVIPMLTWTKMLRIEKTHPMLVFFIVDCLVVWLSKKQNSISLSIVEAEYIVARSYCTQLLWAKQMLKDYKIEQGTMNIHCDNFSAINIWKNFVFHSHTKHIEICHHFIRDLIKEKFVTLEFVPLNIN